MGEWSRRVLFAVNVVLALVCGGVFITIVSAPELVERKVRAQLVRQLGVDARHRLTELESAPWAQTLERVLGKEVERLQTQRASLREELAQRVVTYLETELCHYSCGDSKLVTGQSPRELVHGALDGWLKKYERVLPAVQSWAKAQYHERMTELVRDVGKVALVNFVAFALAALATRRSLGTHAAQVLSLVVLVSALGTTWLYFFAQNWWQSLLFNDWVGYGYAVWLGLLIAVLSDLAFNRGRILGHLLVHLPQALVPPG